MAILRPEWRVTLKESHKRKAVFLREATRGLSNVVVLANSGEDVEGRFDWLVSRAVDPKEVLTNVPQLASQIGLMLGEDDWQALKSNAAIAWAEPIRLPWGDRRLYVVGQVVNLPLIT